MGKRILMISEITPDQKANYRQTLELVKRGGEIFKIPLGNIGVKEDSFNRDNFGDIESLALGIWESQGTDPIEGDLLLDGTFVIINGERRYLAYLWLVDNGYEAEWLGWMHAVIASKETTTTDRKVKKLRANNTKDFEPFEEAAHYKDLLENEGLKAADIARKVGKNRMHVSNRLTLSTITTIEREFINDKLISVTEWVKLAKAMPDIVQRVNALVDATKGGVVVNDTDDILAGYQIKKDFTAEENTEQESTEDLSSTIDNIEADFGKPRIFDDQGEEVNTDPEQAETNPSGLNKKIEDPFLPGENTITDKPKTGLSALLEKSTVPPSEEPDPAYKKKGFTAKDILSDDVGSTLGDQTPEEGTVKEKLKEVVVLIKALERHFKGDSKMSDITFQIDKKVRYLQTIANNSMLGQLTGDVVKTPDPVVL